MEIRKAIGYIRVSTKQQNEDDRYGVDVQKSAILKWADEHGYYVMDWMVDTISGTAADRPAMNEILYGDIVNPPVEAVIVFKNDRVARDTKLYFYYLYTLEKRNIKLLATEEEFTEGSELANVYRALMQFVAEQERRNIALRTGRGRNIKAACGGYSGGRCPYGYKVENKQLVVDPKERELVEYIFSQYDKGVPMLTIADEMYEKGWRTRKGTRFQATSVKSIIQNRPLYEGKYKYGKDMNWVQGVHEPILKG